METGSGINMMKELANYIKAILRSELRGGGEWVPMPNWPMDLIQECQYVVRIMIQALRNESK